MTNTFSPYELLLDWFTKINKNPNCLSIVVSPQRITTIKNNLTHLSNELAKTEPFYSKQLYENTHKKDREAVWKEYIQKNKELLG